MLEDEFHYLEAKPICKQTNKINIVLTADGNTRQWIFQGYSVAMKIYWLAFNSTVY